MRVWIAIFFIFLSVSCGHTASGTAESEARAQAVRDTLKAREEAVRTQRKAREEEIKKTQHQAKEEGLIGSANRSDRNVPLRNNGIKKNQKERYTDPEYGTRQSVPSNQEVEASDPERTGDDVRQGTGMSSPQGNSDFAIDTPITPGQSKRWRTLWSVPFFPWPSLDDWLGFFTKIAQGVKVSLLVFGGIAIVLRLWFLLGDWLVCFMCGTQREQKHRDRRSRPSQSWRPPRKKGSGGPPCMPTVPESPLSAIDAYKKIMFGLEGERQLQRMPTVPESPLATIDEYKKIMFGLEGERQLRRCLERVPGNKKILMNCYIPLNSGGWTECDALMIHASGIYVFESKNIKGEIYGTESDEQWMRRRGDQTSRFYNPCMQNQGHVEKVAEFLERSGFWNLSYHSVIVFGNQCTLCIDVPSGKHRVMKLGNVLHDLAEVLPRETLSETGCESVYQALVPGTQLAPHQKAEHRASAVRSRQRRQQAFVV